MKLLRVVVTWSLGLLLGACSAQSEASTPEGSLKITGPLLTPKNAFSITRVDKAPFTLPSRQPGFRLLMLAYPEVVRGPIFKLTLRTRPIGDLTVAYSFKTAPQGKDRYTEIFLYDGQEFEILGRLAGNTVTDAPLDTRPLFTKARTKIYIFGLSFTRAQYRQACAPIGRFNGSYCGPI